MKAIDVPADTFPIPFADSATGTYKRTVPLTTADPTAASIDLGWPPDTGTPIGAGGSPPDIRDENGIMNQVSAWTRWYEAGGPLYYDSTFSAAIGGYPKQAMLANASTPGAFWISTVDDNVTDPDTGGAGWVPLASLTRAELPQGSYEKLYIEGTASGGGAAVALSVDRISVADSSGNVYTKNSQLAILPINFKLGSSGANGLDTGSPAANTTYYVYTIYDPTNDVWAGILSANSTTPNLAAHAATFTAWRRVGAVRTGATTASFLPSYQRGNVTQLVTPVIPTNGSGVQGTFSTTAPSWQTVTVSPIIPSTAISVRMMATNRYNGAGIAHTMLAPNNAYTGINTVNPPPVYLDSGAPAAQYAEFVIEAAGTVAFVSDNGGGAIFIMGWVDNIP